MAKGKPRMTLDQVATLTAWGIVDMPVVPRQELLEGAVLDVGGTVETTAVGRLSRVVVQIGEERAEAEARATNAATCEALCEVLAALPRVEQGRLDLTPPGLNRETGELGPDAVAFHDAMQAMADRDGVSMTLTTAGAGSVTIGPRGKTAVDPPGARYDDETGAWHNGNGDIYADGTVVEDVAAEPATV